VSHATTSPILLFIAHKQLQRALNSDILVKEDREDEEPVLDVFMSRFPIVFAYL